MSSDHQSRTDARLFAVLTLVFGAYVVFMDGHPTVVFFGASALLLVYFGADLSTIEITDWLRIRFREAERDDD